jgi:hypothetical protein
MRPPRRPADSRAASRGLELLLFLAVSAAGVYALGNGLYGVFEPGRGIDLAWLAVAGGAIWVLFSQMRRVHDHWPRRPRAEHRSASPVAQTGVGKTARAVSADDSENVE